MSSSRRMSVCLRFQVIKLVSTRELYLIFGAGSSIMNNGTK